MKLSLTQAVTLAFMLGGTGQAAANMHRAKAFSTLERRQAPQTSAPTYKVEDCGTNRNINCIGVLVPRGEDFERISVVTREPLHYYLDDGSTGWYYSYGSPLASIAATDDKNLYFYVVPKGVEVLVNRHLFGTNNAQGTQIRFDMRYEVRDFDQDAKVSDTVRDFLRNNPTQTISQYPAVDTNFEAFFSTLKWEATKNTGTVDFVSSLFRGPNKMTCGDILGLGGGPLKNQFYLTTPTTNTGGGGHQKRTIDGQFASIPSRSASYGGGGHQKRSESGYSKPPQPNGLQKPTLPRKRDVLDKRSSGGGKGSRNGDGHFTGGSGNGGNSGGGTGDGTPNPGYGGIGKRSTDGTGPSLGGDGDGFGNGGNSGGGTGDGNPGSGRIGKRSPSPYIFGSVDSVGDHPVGPTGPGHRKRSTSSTMEKRSPKTQSGNNKPAPSPRVCYKDWVAVPEENSIAFLVFYPSSDDPNNPGVGGVGTGHGVTGNDGKPHGNNHGGGNGNGH